jgi:hypothetical protein
MMGHMSGAFLKARRFYAAACLVALLAGVAGALRPVVGLALIGILIVVPSLVINARMASPLLVVLAIPLARPNILGESFSAVAGALMFLAAILALANDRGRLRIGMRGYRSLRSVTFWLAMAYVWLLAHAGSFDRPIQPLLQSLVLVVGVVAAFSIIVADPTRRSVVAWGFIGLLLLQCASYVVTLMLWAVSGIGAGLLVHMPATLHSFDTAVYFPGTITVGAQAVLGLTLPRFDGIGREPGWMALWCAFTYFLIPRLTKRRLRFARLLLLLGMLGTFSTAGFGVFLIVWSFETFLRPRPGVNPLFGYGRQVIGIAVIAGAAWLAIKAPVFGLEAKSILNATSLDDRSQATSAGIAALQTSPWGVATGAQSSINLIGAIAGVGLPFSLAVLAALFMPLRTHPARRLAIAPVAVLALVLLTSQPALDSTWVYVCAVLAYAVTLPPWAAELEAESLRVVEGIGRNPRLTPSG